jgi:hypothetical protein
MSVKHLEGELSADYVGQEFTQVEKEEIAAEQEAALRDSIESRGRSIPEIGNPPGVIFTGP